MQISSGAKNSNLPFASVKASEGKAAPAADAKSFSKVLRKSDESPKRSLTPEKQTQEQPTNNDSEAKEENLSSDSKNNLSAQETPATQTPVAAQPVQTAVPVKVAPVKTLKASEETSETAEITKTPDRREVWNDFLGKMGKLGVSAENILQAFNKLSPEDLVKSPEQSLDKIVAALGLNPAQSQQAKAIFSELLTKTKPESFATDMKSADPSLGLLAQAEPKANPKQARATVDNLNRDLFRKAPPVQEQPLKEIPLEAGDDDSKDGKNEKPATPVATQPAKPEFAAAVATKAPTAHAAANIQAPKAAAAMNRVVEKMEAVKPEDAQAIQETLKNAPKQSAGQLQAQSMLAPTATAAPAVATEAPVATPTPALNALLEKLNISNSDKKDSSSQDGDSKQDIGGQGITADLASAVNSGAKTEFQNHLGQAQAPVAGSTAQPVMTMPELINQAQVMLRDGGGDMKVTLKQEGLGEVAMKVSVDSGKVNIQMITQTDDAKKMLEHQLGDLKAGLAANHLQVESIKIDTSGNLQSNLEQQYKDAQRQQTQAQWEQFRQDTGNGAWKRNYFDQGSLGGAYPGQGRGPRDIAAPSASTASSSRRLNLVA